MNSRELKEEKSVWRKKCDFEKIEEACDRGNTRIFCQRAKEERKGYKPRTVFCKAKNGNFLGNKDRIMERWRS